MACKQPETPCISFKTGVFAARSDCAVFPQVKVMHKQLVLYHNAVSNYFTGNQRALEGTLKQFHVKTPSAADPSFLEKDSA